MSCELTRVYSSFEPVQRMPEDACRPDTVETHKMQPQMPERQIK